MLKSVAHLTAVAAMIVTGQAVWHQAAQAAPSRDTMEQCAVRVIARLVKAKAPEDTVGPAVVKDCDRPLRAALAEAIKAGEAGGCTVESCLALARERATEEATEQYRQKAAATP